MKEQGVNDLITLLSNDGIALMRLNQFKIFIGKVEQFKLTINLEFSVVISGDKIWLKGKCLSEHGDQ